MTMPQSGALAAIPQEKPIRSVQQLIAACPHCGRMLGVSQQIEVIGMKPVTMPKGEPA